MDISGVGAIVTGGASGLGGATAARLAAAGAKVAGTATTQGGAEAIGERLGGDNRGYVLDVNDANGAAALVAQVTSDLGAPLVPDAIEALHGEPSLGLGMLPHASGFKNLYFASRLTLPGLGLEGEFAAGTMAAGLVAPPAKSPFSRSPLLKRA